MGTHLVMLSERYPMNTNMTGFRWFSKSFAFLCFGQKEPKLWKGYYPKYAFLGNFLRIKVAQ